PWALVFALLRTGAAGFGLRSRMWRCPGLAVVTYIVRPSGVKYISSGTPIFIGPKSKACEKVKVFVPGFQVRAASVPSYMLVTYATGGLLPGTKRISTGAALAGDGLVDTLISPSHRPVLASMTPTASPGSPGSVPPPLLVFPIRSMPLWMAIRWGYLSGSLMVRTGTSVTASPTITASEPIQDTYQLRLSSEKTTSSPTWQSGMETTFTLRAGSDIWITRSSAPRPRAVMYALDWSRL